MLLLLAINIEANLTVDTYEDRVSIDSAENEASLLLLGLVISFICISVFLCGYVTHRMGINLWTGPLELTSSASSASPHTMHIMNGGIGMAPAVDICPPSYKSIVTLDEELPPSYESVICQKEKNDVNSVAQHEITIHI